MRRRPVRRLVRNHGRYEGSHPARGGLVTAAQCGQRFERTDYISGVSGLDDGAVGDGSCGVGGVSGAAGCGTAAGCFSWALVAAALRAAALRMRVFAAFCPAARCFRVATAFLAAARRLRVVAAFFPALFLGLISSSVQAAARKRLTVSPHCPDEASSAMTSPGQVSER